MPLDPPPPRETAPEPEAEPEAQADGKHPFLTALGERVRALRARRGMTRKALARAADVSERHLANLEYGVGNASVLVLLQVADALQCTLAELVGDVTASSPEWLLLREMLGPCDEPMLQQVRHTIAQVLGQPGGPDTAPSAPPRVALVGLRGAGKSTLGQRLAADLGWRFVELSREVERLAGCSTAEVQALYGINAYRRHERRALDELLHSDTPLVIATPGGLVTEPATFGQLLGACTTVWLQASPEDHMRRVLDQGDLRPMAASREAMQDLKAILASRAPFYGQAQWALDTSAQPLEATFSRLRALVRTALQLPA